MTRLHREFGPFLVERGLLSREELDEVQRDGPVTETLVVRSILSRAQTEEAQGAFHGLVRFCVRCRRIERVPVLTVDGIRCALCLDRLEWREEAAATKLQHLQSVVSLTKVDLPPEVEAVAGIPSRTFGKYVVLEELGRGGTGVVRRAWDLITGDFVALKFVSERRSIAWSTEEAKLQQEAQVESLLREARAAMRLHHEHIVAIRDVGIVDKQFYISMEFIEGRTLADHIRAARERCRLSCLYEDPLSTLRLMRDVARAIHYAHTFPKPVIHCDLKPSNIMISTAGVASVLDFGIARILGKPTEVDDAIRGTPGYMAPEQLPGATAGVGPWTDVYGLGAILYELLTGSPVFTGHMADLMTKTMSEAPRRPTEVVRGTLEADRDDTTRLLRRLTRLEKICLHCLAKDPRGRYPSARDLAEDLEAVCGALETGESKGVASTQVRQAVRATDLRLIDERLCSLRFGEIVEASAVLMQKYQADPTACDLIAERLGYVEILQKFLERLCAGLDNRRPTLARLDLQEGSFQRVVVQRTTTRRLYFRDAAGLRGAEWSSVPALQLVALAEAAGLSEPQDQLALGVLCHFAGYVEAASRFLKAVEGTPYQDSARRLLEGVRS